MRKGGRLLAYVWDSPSVARRNVDFRGHRISPLSEVIRYASGDTKVVLVAVYLVVKGRHEVVDLRNAECDSAAYVELNAAT